MHIVMSLIHLVDASPSTRASISYLLSEQGYSVRAYETTRDLLLAEPADEDCIIADLSLSDPPILEIVRDLREAGCTAAVIATGGDSDFQSGIDALKAGAVDFVRTPFAPAGLTAAVEAAFDLADSGRLRGNARHKASAALRCLSEREVQILRGLLTGMSNKEMARALGISPRTVEMHRANLMADLKLKSQAEAIRLAVDAELTPLEYSRDRAEALDVEGRTTSRPRSRPFAPLDRSRLPSGDELLEATTDCVFILDLEDRFVFINQNAIDTIARGQDLIGLRVWDVFPGARSTRAYPQMREAIEETAPRRFDFFEPDLEKWFDVAVRPIVGGILVCFRDLTPKRAAIAALKMSEERLRLALEASGDGAWDYDLRTGEVQMSDRFLARLGYAPGEVEPCFDAVRGLIHPDDRQKVIAAIESHLCGQDEVFQCEYRLRTKAGQWCWSLDRGRVVARDPRSGAPTRMVGTATDITSVKNLQASSEEAHERLELAQLEAGAGIWDLDLETRELNLCSRSREMMGIQIAPETQLKESDWIACIHRDDLQQVMAKVEQAAATNGQFVSEFRVDSPDGSVRRILALGKLVSHSDGRRRFIGLNIDLAQMQRDPD